MELGIHVLLRHRLKPVLQVRDSKMLRPDLWHRLQPVVFYPISQLRVLKGSLNLALMPYAADGS